MAQAEKDLSTAFGLDSDRDFQPRTAGTGSAPWGTRILKALASLRLTVVLFILSLVLVWTGTLAQRQKGIWEVVDQYFRSIVAWIEFENLFVVWPAMKGLPGTTGFWYPGGWTIGAFLLANLLAAHAVRFKLSWKRSGIITLHAGLVLMLVGELVTGLFAVEGNMVIAEGQAVNYVDHTGQTELAFFDPADPAVEDVVVIPQQRLQRGVRISHDLLSCDVEVLRYYKNSRLEDAKRDGENLATAGAGLQFVAVERPPVRGTDSEQKIDMAAAYVKLYRKGTDESLGVYLVSIWQHDANERLTIDGKPFELALRHRRSYRPFAVHLIDFRHDKYVGTEKPKNFSSLVRLVDPERNVDRQVLIYMNNPLRYRGETFYQSSFLPGDAGTVLQVVRNPGWLLPYFSCVVVSLGMLLHFALSLRSFFERFRQRERRREPLRGKAALVPWAATALAAVFLGAKLAPQSHGEPFDFATFRTLPVVYNGREKPVDTFARNTLMVLSDRQTFRDAQARQHSAVEWLLDVWANDGRAEKYKFFRIENDQVLELLSLKARPGFRYAWEEFDDKLEELEKQARAAHARDEKDRDLFDVKLMELYQQLQLFVQVSNLQVPHLVPPFSPGEEWSTYRSSEDKVRQLAMARLRDEVLKGKLDPHKTDQSALMARMQAVMREVRRELAGELHPAEEAWNGILAAYRAGESADFNRAVADYHTLLKGKMSDQLKKARLEVVFNRFEPFYQCAVLYVLVGLLACASWLGWERPLGRSAAGIFAVTLAVHSIALVARMYLQGRPPVTNLYSSAIFIGWACALLGIVLEYFFRNTFGLILGSVTGFLSLLVAHHLAGDGDTMEMMQAVLDTNFWLASHVVTITIGYSGTFLAGFLGLCYVLLGLLSKSFDKEAAKTLGRMIYAIVCFATFFSFVGTVLGGIWADQSWGRFWGWDPKENGALLIVIWNALVLHARWAGMVQLRGLALLAIGGNIVTAWSWFGVNMLGIGLHSYGFMPAALFWLLMFEGSQLAWIGLGSLGAASRS